MLEKLQAHLLSVRKTQHKKLSRTTRIKAQQVLHKTQLKNRCKLWTVEQQEIQKCIALNL
jgi:hypothetical protein